MLSEELILHTDHPLKVERLLSQILELSSVHYLFLSALVDLIEFKGTDNLKSPLFHP